ncbi:MAG: ABC transporter substrate-binding protein [Candidatus Binatia bacterium]
MRTLTLGRLSLASMLLLVSGGSLQAAERQTEWAKIVDAGKKEGKVVLATTSDPELRNKLLPAFERRFNIAVEYNGGRAPQQAARIVQENRAGVRYFDVFVFGGCGGLGVLEEGALEPLRPFMVLPEVTDEKYWWGGAIWADNVKTNRYLYSFTANGGVANRWYNSTLLKAEEIRSYDDLLNPKLKGKIGILDPRSPGAGQGTWAFLWRVKGEGFLQKLVQQDLFVTRNARQLGDALSKEKIAICLGCSRHAVTPFIDAGLPIEPLPAASEGDEASSGYALGVVKNPPHPNAAKVFVNWLLSKEGQELWSRSILNGTRRADVDTRWLEKHDVSAAKDKMTVEQYHKFRNHLQDFCEKVREPATALAEKLLK